MAVLPLDHVLRQLREELARVDYLIRLLSMAARKSRRGRPPKFLARPRAVGGPKRSQGRIRKR